MYFQKLSQAGVESSNLDPHFNATVLRQMTLNNTETLSFLKM